VALHAATHPIQNTGKTHFGNFISLDGMSSVLFVYKRNKIFFFIFGC